MANEGLADLMDSLKYPEFCKAFALDPMGTLQNRKIDGVPYELVKVLAELSYDELRLGGNIGGELKVAVGNGGGVIF